MNWFASIINKNIYQKKISFSKIFFGKEFSSTRMQSQETIKNTICKFNTILRFSVQWQLTI